MFRKESPSAEFNQHPQHPRLETVIGDGTRVSGEVKVDGNVRVDGEVEGTIEVTGMVSVGKTGVVKADVEAGSAEIAGRVVGKISARDRVVLVGGSRLEGDVQSQSFKIEDGAFFQGNCIMGERRTGSAKSEPETPRIKLAKSSEG